MHEAILYEKLEESRVRCAMCRHRCTIKPGKRGICSVRENREGTLYTLVYDHLAARGVDPIEKKPLFHFFPGSLSYSIATMGCNFSCTHCQNCHLSQTPAAGGAIEGATVPPEEVVRDAVAMGCKSISYTYSEPTIYGELALETARIAKENGLYNNFVTNGYESPELIQEMTGLIDGANVDLKSFSDYFYEKICHGKLEGVLDTIRRMHGAGIWVEVTTLLIPGLNDKPEELEKLAGFIVSVSPDIPWHISRYHPAHKMVGPPPTPPKRLEKAREIGLDQGLKYVYTGNVPGDAGESTYCHHCKERIIHRVGFAVKQDDLKDGRCPHCNTEVAGVFN